MPAGLRPHDVVPEGGAGVTNPAEFTGNCPKNVSKDAKYAVRSGRAGPAARARLSQRERRAVAPDDRGPPRPRRDGQRGEDAIRQRPERPVLHQRICSRHRPGGRGSALPTPAGSYEDPVERRVRGQRPQRPRCRPQRPRFRARGRMDRPAPGHSVRPEGRRWRRLLRIDTAQGRDEEGVVERPRRLSAIGCLAGAHTVPDPVPAPAQMPSRLVVVSLPATRTSMAADSDSIGVIWPSCRACRSRPRMSSTSPSRRRRARRRAGCAAPGCSAAPGWSAPSGPAATAPRTVR